ncbi:MAG: major capsid protein [Thermoplasmata archaeon]
MAGGLIQLVAYGVQDLYLTGDPQITFFKIIYRRHTNFAIESIPQNFSSMANFGETVSCILSRSGDLVGRIFLFVKIPALEKFMREDGGEDAIKKVAWVRNLGYAIILDVSIEIGGKLVDKQYGEWLYIWSQVTSRHDIAIDRMIGNIPQLYHFSNGKSSYQLYIPLEFWFCKSPGLSLPLVSLSSSDVKIIVTFRRLDECIRIGPTHSIELDDDVVPFSLGDYIEQTVRGQTIYGYVMGYDYLRKKLFYIKIQSPNATKKEFEAGADLDVQYRIYHSITREYVIPRVGAKEMVENTILPYKPSFVNSFLYVNYIYLDSEERAKFSRSNHEYLIEQIQFNQDLSVKSPNVNHRMSLNHPCKSIYWVVQLDSLVGPGTINDLFNYTTSPVRYREINDREGFYGVNLVRSAKLVINGHERFSERTSEYFNLVEPYQHHFRGPVVGINVYSFSLNPEEHQPSSAINMSEIDQVILQMKLDTIISPQNTAKIRSYTVSYNLFRMFFHMGGLAFD